MKRILLADDNALDRKVIMASFTRLAPTEFELIEHGECSTIIERSLDLKPHLLILDRAFTKNQLDNTPEGNDALVLAHRIREQHPVELQNMAVLVYSRYTQPDEGASFSDRFKKQGIWSRAKDRDHQILIAHVREILNQWPRS